MQSSVREFVHVALARQAGRELNSAPDLNTKFSATGLDSLDLMELLNEVEEQFDILITDDTVTAETTVEEFIQYVEAKVATATATRGDA